MITNFFTYIAVFTVDFGAFVQVDHRHRYILQAGIRIPERAQIEVTVHQRNDQHADNYGGLDDGLAIGFFCFVATTKTPLLKILHIVYDRDNDL